MSLNRIINHISSTSPLLKLIDENAGARHVGFTIHASYSEMCVLTNDLWRSGAGGLPMNGYLLATSLLAEKYASSKEIDRRVVLFRIAGRSDIATDRETVDSILRHFQDNPDTDDPSFERMDPLTRGIMQWSGIKCKILGTFHINSAGHLEFGADIEDFFASRQMRVLKPGQTGLSTIVNFVDPTRLARAETDAREQGMKKLPKPFRIGHVRFTSSRHMGSDEEHVPVTVYPGDFLSRRTAVFGMTRTGKSNTTKTMVSAVLMSALETDLAIGQLILDINGEYSNANGQDKGSLADAFASNTVRYRAMKTPGFSDLRLNFYDSLDLGLHFIAGNIKDSAGRLSEDLQAFVSLDLNEPDPQAAYDIRTKWSRRKSIYQAILFRSGYEPPKSFVATIDVNKDVLWTLYKQLTDNIDPEKQAVTKDAQVQKAREHYGLSGTRSPYSASLDKAKTFWTEVRDVERQLGGYQSDTKGIRVEGKKWLDDVDGAMLSILVGKSGKSDTPIRSSNIIRSAAVQFHSSTGSANVGRDIYKHLSDGRVVIADLSVGPPIVRERMAERIAEHIFHASTEKFTAATVPPKIVIYVEEAHNLIGKNADLNETWPRIAKEGAKYGIALVYATQEPSSVHSNILANTENFFVTHLNNDGEVRALSGYYDFADFSDGIKRCQDVGFARIKTLSSSFTVSAQIDKFEVSVCKSKFDSACTHSKPTWFSPLPRSEV